MTKQIYWKCVDCNSMINDENMHLLEGTHGEKWYPRQKYIRYAEFCYGCMNYNPEVVLAYA